MYGLTRRPLLSRTAHINDKDRPAWESHNSLLFMRFIEMGKTKSDD